MRNEPPLRTENPSANDFESNPKINPASVPPVPQAEQMKLKSVVILGIISAHPFIAR